MVDPLRTPTISPNNQLSNSLTQTQHFQETFYQIKELWVAAGASILLSNGGGTAGAGDNIPNAAAVTTGLAGTGAWFVAEFADLGGNAVRILFNVNDNATPFQLTQFRIGNATWSGGSTSALPTATGFATPNATITIDPFTDNRNKRWSSWYSANNDGAQSMRFFMKEEGGSARTNVCWIEIIANTDDDGGGKGANRWAVVIGNSGVTASNVQSTGNWQSVNIGGSAQVQPSAESALWRLSSNWTGGVDIANTENLQPPLIGANVAAGRLYGAWIDAFAIPSTTTTGIFSDSTESGQTYRRMNFGDMAWFWPDGVGVL